MNKKKKGVPSAIKGIRLRYIIVYHRHDIIMVASIPFFRKILKDGEIF